MSKFRFLAFIVIFSLFISSICVSNAEEVEKISLAVDPTIDSGYSVVLYDNTNGLPTSTVNAIAQTEEGFIWIGSYSGLIRYDGKDFVRLDSTTGVASVRCLLADSKNRLWIGTNENGLAVMEKGKFRMYKKADGLKSSSIRDLAEASNGDVYLASTYGVSYIDSEMNLHVVESSKLEMEYIRSIVAGTDDIIYGVSIEGDIFTLRYGKLTAFYSHEHMAINGITCILTDCYNQDHFYFGTDQGRIYYGVLNGDISEYNVIDISPLSYVNSMKQIDGEIWLACDNGIGVVKEGGIYTLSKIPLNNSVERVMIDYAGNMWFTSSRQGVMKIVPNQFSDLFEKYNLESRVVNSTCISGDILFMGTDNGLIAVDEKADYVLESIPITQAFTPSGMLLDITDLLQMLGDVRIRSIIRDSHDRIWFSTWKSYGLVCYDNGILTVYSTDDGLPSTRVRAIHECKDGRILVACTGGVAVIQDDKIVKSFTESSGIENTEILTVTEAENGDIIAGSDGGGIYIISNSKTTYLGTDDGLNSEVIMRIKKSVSGDFYWIVTSNSIAFMEEGNYKITTVQHFPYPNNFDIYENSQGDVWVLSSNGIYVERRDVLHANGEISPVFYGKENGLQSISTSNSYSELNDDGYLYIAGSTGVVKVNIETPIEGINDVKVAVPFIEVDGEVIYPNEDGSFTIDCNAQKLTVYSYAYTYSLMNPQVSYMLDGFDKEEITVNRSELIPVIYTNLRGGTYHFIINLHDSMGRGNKRVTTLIVKQKNFYEQTWFYIVLCVSSVFFIVVIIQFIIRNKMKNYQKKEEENKALIRGITQAFAKVVDMKDHYTNGHSSRVAEYTAMLARELGYNDDEIEKYYNIALLHDIGKIGIPEDVLNKPGRLTDEEYEIIKSHTKLGFDALKEIKIMPELAIGAMYHHERPDGLGYNKLKNGDIPKVAQIIGVADAFDAMYSNRPYRNRMNFEKVVEIIKDGSGTQFSPEVVKAFLNLVAKGEFKAPDDNGGGSTEIVDNSKREHQ